MPAYFEDKHAALAHLNKFRDLIEESIIHGKSLLTFKDVEDRVLSGRMTIWANDGGVSVTELIQTPTKRIVNTSLCGGELKSLEKLQRETEASAAELGIDAVMIVGRKGWGKVFDDYEEAATVYVKEIKK